MIKNILIHNLVRIRIRYLWVHIVWLLIHRYLLLLLLLLIIISINHQRIS